MQVDASYSELEVTYNNVPRSDCCNLLAPLRRPSLEFSKAAFVTSLNADVIAPDAAMPAENDWIQTIQTSSIPCLPEKKPIP